MGRPRLRESAICQYCGSVFEGAPHRIKIQKFCSPICASHSEARKGKIPWNKNKKWSEKTRGKISKACKGRIPWNKGILNSTGIGGKKNKGRKYSKEVNKKKGRPGSLNPNWQGGNSLHPYTYEFNKELKDLIRLRDGYKCQLCGMTELENLEKLSIHHIDYKKQNCLPSNLITLCRRCNSKVNFNRYEEQFKKTIIKNLCKVNHQLQLCY